MRYATPLLRAPTMPVLRAPKEAVLSRLCATERRLSKDYKLSEKHQEELDKLVQSGYVCQIPTEQTDQPKEIWYFPHHLVEHNNKHRVVFDCSFEYMGQNLNRCLLPCPYPNPLRSVEILKLCFIRCAFWMTTSLYCILYGEECSWIIHHLPPDAKSKTSELWLSGNGEPKELTLGLQWNCLTDMLNYKTKTITWDQNSWDSDPDWHNELEACWFKE